MSVGLFVCASELIITYHVCNNYITYGVAIRLYFGLLDGFEYSNTGVATIGSL